MESETLSTIITEGKSAKQKTKVRWPHEKATDSVRGFRTSSGG